MKSSFRKKFQAVWLDFAANPNQMSRFSGGTGYEALDKARHGTAMLQIESLVELRRICGRFIVELRRTCGRFIVDVHGNLSRFLPQWL